MISDLVFIGVFGLGCALVGLHFRTKASKARAALGWAILASGVVFTLTDYGETIAQLIQLTSVKGDDALAGFASSMGPFKVASFLFCFIAVPAALLWDAKASDPQQT